jgi:hypothetical protein
MSYWKCLEATISDDGLSVTLGFKDEHSCSSHTMTFSTEVWKNILTYKAAYDEPHRRMYEAQKQLFDYWRDRIELDREETK